MFFSETISAVVTTWGNKSVFNVDISLKFGLVKCVRPVKLKMEYFFGARIIALQTASIKKEAYCD